jgi:hypothetical protein
MSYAKRLFPALAFAALTLVPLQGQSLTPFLNSIQPSSAPAGAPEFLLTVSGTNFGALAVVRWNGGDLETIKFPNNPNVLQAIVPAALVAQPGQAIVTVFNGFAVSNGLPFIITEPPPPPPGQPSITAVSPQVIPAGGGDVTLNISGENFSATAVVLWDNLQLGTEYVSATRLNARVPAQLVASPGSAAVRVSQGNFVSNAEKVYIVERPVISELSPPVTTRGAPALPLVVYGSGFLQSSTVLWNGNALSTSFVNPNRIVALVPASFLASAGQSAVVVSNEVRPDPQIPSLVARVLSPAAFFRVLDGPAVSSLQPASTTAGSGELKLLVRGAGFASGAAVNWNGAPLATVFRSPNELEATVPAALVANIGNASITVSLLQSTSNALPFQVIQGPAIHRLIPDSATRGSATFTLRVLGTGFSSASRVLWEATTLPTTFISANELRAQVAAAFLSEAGSPRVFVVSGLFTSLPARFNVTTGPAIWSLEPSSVVAGSPALTLTVAGTGFAPGAQVRWEGSALSTEFLSTTTLRALIPQNLLARSGAAQVTVTLQQVSSMPAVFAVTEPLEPPPPALTLTSINPNSAFAGGQGFTLTVTGAGFNQNTVVRWNETALQTTFVSATTLNAAVPAALIANPGTAQVRVIRGQDVAGPLDFTIRAAMTLTSLNPSVAIAGGPALTLAVNGTGFVSGAVVRWNQTDLSTEFVSATRLNAAVPAALVAAAGTANVSVSALNFTTASLPFSIEAALAITSVSPSSAIAGSADLTLTVAGSGFTQASVVRWNETPLVTRFVSGSSLSALVPAPLLASPGTALISAANPSGNRSGTLPFTVQPLVLPTVQIQGISDTANPTEQPVIRLGLSGEFTVPLSGRITVSFDSDAVDKADSLDNVRLENGRREFAFTVPDRNSPLPSVGLQVGTIAGRITVNVIIEVVGGVRLNPPNVTTRVVTVPRSAPTVTRACLARTSTGFDAVVIGYATPREVTRAVYRFTAAAGANLQTLELTPAGTGAAFTAWFATETSKSLGSAFRLVQSFTVSGDQNAIQSASVTLSNSVGDSAARTAAFESNCPNN